MSLDMPTRDFAASIGFVVGVTGKDSSEMLNKYGLTALIGGKGVRGALQRTPKADTGRIERDLMQDKLAIKIVMARAKRMGKKLTRRQIAQQVKALIRRRKGSTAYTRGPGWNNAIKDMGGRGIRTNKRFGTSEARHGKGTMATASRLKATIVNTAPASEKIGLRPLRDALNDTARDAREYGERKLQQRFNQVKPR